MASGGHLGNQVADHNGGYRVSHDRGAVTVGNEAPVWPLADSRQRYDAMGR
jgi:hypothetical protein